MAISISPHIEDSSYLIFEFKKKDGTTFPRRLSFLENIDIKESLKANYSEYTPIGSNGSVFAYLGSKSRELSVEFNLTLPNIEEHTLVNPTAGHLADPESVRESYFSEASVNPTSLSITKNYFKAIQDYELKFFGSLTSQEQNSFKKLFPERFKEYVGSSAISALTGFAPPIAERDRRRTALMQVLYWLNLIRSSCITNSERPYLGPPLVYLNHGMMYMNVPTICTEYDISMDKEGGYDTQTLLPRILKFSIKLREVRLKGKSFAPGTDTAKFMPGWESLQGEDAYITLDPYKI